MLTHTSCPLETTGGPFNKHGQISILIQLYISQGSMNSISLYLMLYILVQTWIK